ncbi:T9SS type A sorting domain-containing protein [candidate division KSB1 bacterium]|nr:T9SS type A sorting domain-containing protein [candidate division KSB1 bacterium]
MKRWIVFMSVVLILSVKGFAQDWQSFTTDNSGLPSNNVFSIDTDETGTMWFGTDSGVAAYNGLKWYTYSESSDLADKQVNDLGILRTSELWAATDNGVSAMDVSSLDAITMATPYRVDNTGLLSNRINAIAIDENHYRWFGTDSGVTVFSGSNWISTRTQNVVLRNDVMAIAHSPDSLVYCGTEGGGIARLKLSGLDVITGASTIERPWTPMPIDSVYAIYIGSDSVQWFGTTQGLFLHFGIDAKNNWWAFMPQNGLPHRMVQAITEDRAGRFWVGTAGGVSCIEGYFVSYRNYTTADGLIHDNVRDIVVAADGCIWFATAGGVSKFNPCVNKVQAYERLKAQSYNVLHIYPNPFNMSTSIEFRLEDGGEVDLSIYDVTGRRVCNLRRGHLDEGMHVENWDGKDDRGVMISSGIYLVRLATNKHISTGKMLVVK